MLSLVTQGYRFHLRAAAIIQHAGFTLLHRAEGDDFWALPGGRVEPGENASASVARELLEELNEQVVPEELRYVVENFFEHGGEHHHELGLYFSTQLQAHSGILDKTLTYEGIEGKRTLFFKWFNPSELANTDVRPKFLATLLQSKSGEIRHIIQRASSDA